MPLEIVLITGMSGSGKSVALHALEDAGFFCVDNLPPDLLLQFVSLEPHQRAPRLAIAMDARSARSLDTVPTLLKTLQAQGHRTSTLFLDATTDTLMRRYSETRRKHPLSQQLPTDSAQDMSRALVNAIELERNMLSNLREHAHVIDTSLIRASQLQSYVKDVISSPAQQLTLVFESFAFKRGVPVDADYVFDVRMLPNPHYEPALRELTGQDKEVQDFLRSHAEVSRMLADSAGFLQHWLQALARDHRSYVTVAIGCTGGQHRSVYLVEQLAHRFEADWHALKRHRELDADAP